MFTTIRQEFNIWKDKIRTPTFIKIGLEYLCLEGLDQNSNVWKDKKIVLMLIEIEIEFHCSGG